jgi:hypothetical protein
MPQNVLFTSQVIIPLRKNTLLRPLYLLSLLLITTKRLETLDTIQTHPTAASILLLAFILAFTFLLLLLLDVADGFLGQFLSVHALEDVLLASALVADPNEQTGGGVHSDGAGENDSGDSHWPSFVVYTPGAGA